MGHLTKVFTYTYPFHSNKHKLTFLKKVTSHFTRNEPIRLSQMTFSSLCYWNSRKIKGLIIPIYLIDEGATDIQISSSVMDKTICISKKLFSKLQNTFCSTLVLESIFWQYFSTRVLRFVIIISPVNCYWCHKIK